MKQLSKTINRNPFADELNRLHSSTTKSAASFIYLYILRFVFFTRLLAHTHSHTPHTYIHTYIRLCKQMNDGETNGMQRRKNMYIVCIHYTYTNFVDDRVVSTPHYNSFFQFSSEFIIANRLMSPSQLSHPGVVSFVSLYTCLTITRMISVQNNTQLCTHAPVIVSN